MTEDLKSTNTKKIMTVDSVNGAKVLTDAICLFILLYKKFGRKRPSFNITQSFIAYDKANENLEKTSTGKFRQGYALSTLSNTGASPKIYASLVNT